MPGALYLRSFVVGLFDTNCYLIADQASRDALIIDPGDDHLVVLEAVHADRLSVQAILNTHAHADHIAANGALKKEFGCPIMIHEADAPGLADPEANLSGLAGYEAILSPPADRLLVEGDDIAVGGLAFRVIHTPGHTPGGICLLGEEFLFSGDTLFAGGIGRTDFPGGSHEQLVDSIRRKLLVLPDGTIVYPGHGPQTTIGAEKDQNPWLT